MKKALSLLTALVLVLSAFTLSAAAFGTVTVTPAEHGSASYEINGTALTVTVTPDKGYALDFGMIMQNIGVFSEPVCDFEKKDLTGNTFTYDFGTEISEDITVSVFFKEYPAGIYGNVTVTPCENGSVTYEIQGTQLTLSVRPDAGYELDFCTVMRSLGAFSEPVCYLTGDDIHGNSYTYDFGTAIEDDITISAFFKKTASDVMKGDFDGDKAITVADALAALRIGAKLVEETPEAIAIGDTDNDGHVTVADALAILRVAARLADHL